MGWHPPAAGPDYFLLGLMLAIPLFGLVSLAALWSWYKRIWSRRLREIWPVSRDRRVHGRWRPLRTLADDAERSHRSEYLSALSKTSPAPSGYEALAEATLADLERDIAERALTTGLVVGISRNRFVDLVTILIATLELQLHVLTRLGKRPSLHTWKLLIQRCGASLFLNSYLNRHDALLLNLMIKKAGMGLHAAGDVMDAGIQHLSDQDIDLDDALNLSHSGLLGIATKGIEMGAFMALSVGQVGLRTLGTLIESVGDELAQGALAAGIIYYHGISLASDTLALDQRHRASLAMNRSVRDGVWRMGEIAGTILLDFIRQRRNAFRERRRQAVKGLPKTAYEGIQTLFGRKLKTGA
ncbi:MAG: hypothetical protein M3Y27_13920, partial [Acidobacteriota bacterium]|nr:hypothetical protein [Acidobacteriota bacterium]